MYMIDTLNPGSTHVEPQQITANSPLKRPKHKFTPANAKQFASKGGHARHQAYLKEREILRSLTATAMALPRLEPDDAFRQRRLERVRQQLNRLDEMAAKEKNPLTLDRLYSAIAKLAEQERILAGRPLPGSHRPSKQRQEKAATAADALELPDHLVAQVQQLDTQ
jgi:hypothetical protein